MERIKWLHEWGMLGIEDLKRLLMSIIEQEAICTGKGIDEEWRPWLHVPNIPISLQTNPSHMQMQEYTDPSLHSSTISPFTCDPCNFIELCF